MLESARVDKICHDHLEEILVSLHFVRKRADIRGNLGDIPRVLARFLVPPRFVLSETGNHRQIFQCCFWYISAIHNITFF